MTGTRKGTDKSRDNRTGIHKEQRKRRVADRGRGFVMVVSGWPPPSSEGLSGVRVTGLCSS